MNEATAKRQILSAVRMLRNCGGQGRIDQAAGYLAIRSRSFRRDVKALAGLSPKTLARIFRFPRTPDLLNEGVAFSLGDVAPTAGYTDQPHMTREFQMLGGFTPKSPIMLPCTSQHQGAN